MSRLRRLAAAAALTAAASVPLAGTAFAQDDPFDCGDFATQTEAQQQYDSTSGDPSGLDADDDGMACESLPANGGTGNGDAQPEQEADDQVEQQPQGGVDTGNSTDGIETAYVLGALALTGAAATAGASGLASRRARKDS